MPLLDLFFLQSHPLRRRVAAMVWPTVAPLVVLVILGVLVADDDVVVIVATIVVGVVDAVDDVVVATNIVAFAAVIDIATLASSSSC
jgi:hypothetical protein